MSFREYLNESRKWVNVGLDKIRTAVLKEYPTMYWVGTKSFGSPEQSFDKVNSDFENVGNLTLKNKKGKEKILSLYIGTKMNDGKIQYSYKVEMIKLFSLNIPDSYGGFDSIKQMMPDLKKSMLKEINKLNKKGYEISG